jgi:hypothetical protein
MTIEIHNPELESLLQQRINAGDDVEEMLLHALRGAPVQEKRATTLVEFFRASPLVGLELEFDRDRDMGRDISL